MAAPKSTTSSSQIDADGNVAHSNQQGKSRAPKQKKATASRNSRKTFQPYHSIHVPKAVDLQDRKHYSFVDGVTLMLRNIPNNYTQAVLLQEIDKLGFEGTYDFFYLPMDVHNRANVGYAFINFIHPASATRCYEVFSNYKFQWYQSKKICEVSHAHLQGFEKNVKHFQHRAVMNAQDEQYRPVVLRGGGLKHCQQKHSQTLELEKALFTGQRCSDTSNVSLAKELPEVVESYEKSDSKNSFSNVTSPWPITNDSTTLQDVQPQWLPEPRLVSDLPCSQKVFSELSITHVGLAQAATTPKSNSYSPMPLKMNAFASKLSLSMDLEYPKWTALQSPGNLQELCDLSLGKSALGRSFELGNTTPELNHFKLSLSVDPEDPEWIVPQGPGKLPKPPGHYLDKAAIGSSIQPDDKTPRTNHSLLEGCFGPTSRSYFL